MDPSTETLASKSEFGELGFSKKLRSHIALVCNFIKEIAPVF
jgi:hypothetical protein